MTAFQNVLDSFKEETSMLSKHELWIATQVFYGLNSKKLANPMLTNSWSESLHFFFIFFPFFHVFLVCSNCKLELRIKYLQRGGENTHDQPDDLLYWCQPQNSIGGFIVTAKDSHVDIDYTKENHIRIQVLL